MYFCTRNQTVQFKDNYGSFLDVPNFFLQQLVSSHVTKYVASTLIVTMVTEGCFCIFSYVT